VKIGLSPRVSAITLGLLVTAIGLTGCASDFGVEDSAAPPVDPGLPTAQTNASIPGEIIIAFKPGASSADKARARGRANAASKSAIPSATGSDLELATLPPGLALKDATDALLSDSAVAFAEPNYVLQHMAFPATATADNATQFEGQLWGLKNVGQTINPDSVSTRKTTGLVAAGTPDVDMDLPGPIATEGTTKVYVGIIDEGIDYKHPDLAGVVGNPQEQGTYEAQDPAFPDDPTKVVVKDRCTDGIDNDLNGYVDDCYGWDFAGGNNSIYDGTTSNTVDSHGTHVSGTIGAHSFDGKGIRGVASNVGIISGKFLGTNGGTTANAIAAVAYFTGLKAEGVNIVALNNSWGGGPFSDLLHAEIAKAGAAGILFVAAAGNETTDVDAKPSYPCSYGRAQDYPATFKRGIYTAAVKADAIPSVICVAAHDQKGLMGPYTATYFSNWGATTVDLSAPGSNILSTIPNGKYAWYRGTSMATPHVTGLVALLASAGVPTSEIKERLRTSVVSQPIEGRPTKTDGRANAYRALYGSDAPSDY
jgi:hypothetical protein